MIGIKAITKEKANAGGKKIKFGCKILWYALLTTILFLRRLLHVVPKNPIFNARTTILLIIVSLNGGL